MTTARSESPAFGRNVTLAAAFREFVHHPSPWIIGTLSLGAVAARSVVGIGRADALVPLVMLALVPCSSGSSTCSSCTAPEAGSRFTIDPLLARTPRAPRGSAETFRWTSFPRGLRLVAPLLIAITVLAFPRLELG